MLKTNKFYKSKLGLTPIYSTKDPDGNPATIGEDAAQAWRDNFEIVEEIFENKADTTNAQGYKVVYAKDGKIEIPEIDTSGLAPKEDTSGNKVVYSKDGKIEIPEVDTSKLAPKEDTTGNKVVYAPDGKIKNNVADNYTSVSDSNIDLSAITDVANTSISGSTITTTQGYYTCSPIPVPQNKTLTITTTNGTLFKERWVLLSKSTDKSGYNSYTASGNVFEKITVFTGSYNYLVLTLKEPATVNIRPYLRITEMGADMSNKMEVLSSDGYTIDSKYTDISDWHTTRELGRWNILGHSLVLKSELVQTIVRPFENRYQTKLVLSDSSNTDTIEFWNRPYHRDLFSIRIKYPVVSIPDDDLYFADGKLNKTAYKATVVTPVPDELTGATVSYNPTGGLTIKNTGGSVIFNKPTSGFTVSDWIAAIEKDIPNAFEVNVVNRYVAESFSNIGEFTDIALTKFTANSYYDCYPAMLKTNSKNKEHRIRISFKVSNDKRIQNFKLSYDGVVFISGLLNNKIVQNNYVTASLDTTVKSLYTPLPVPFFIGSHYLKQQTTEKTAPGSGLTEQLTGTTARFERNLQWLKDHGFVSLNVHEAFTMMQAGTLPERSYVLTTDEINIDWWVDDYKRNMFNRFNCKPTLVVNPDFRIELAVNGVFQNQVDLFTKQNISEMLQQGWYGIIHPSDIAVSTLGYAEFTALMKKQEQWLLGRGLGRSRYVIWHVGNTTNYQDTYAATIGYHTRITTSEGVPCGNNINGDFAIRRRYWDETTNAEGTATTGGMTFEQFVTLASKYL